MAYLKMKMPGPNGIITVAGDYKKAMQCARVGSTLPESMVIQAEKSKMHEVVAMAKSAQLSVMAMTNPDGRATFEVPKETKRIPIDPNSRSARPSLQPVWTRNRKARSVTSSVRIGISLHGLLMTCLVFRRSW